VTVVVWVLALVVAAIHVLVFVWESVLFRRPSVHRGVFGVASDDVRPVLLWAVNVGFYNLFLAAGLVVGVLAWINGAETTGRTLLTYLASFITLAGLVLFVSDRLALGRPRGTGVTGAIAQTVPALLTLIALLLS
jgi:putative membrane protein